MQIRSIAGCFFLEAFVELQTWSFELREERMTDTSELWEGDGEAWRRDITFDRSDDKSALKLC